MSVSDYMHIHNHRSKDGREFYCCGVESKADPTQFNAVLVEKLAGGGERVITQDTQLFKSVDRALDKAWEIMIEYIKKTTTKTK